MSDVTPTVLIYSHSPNRRKEIEKQLKQCLSNTKIEIWTASCFSQCERLLGHYFNAIIYDGIAVEESVILDECHKLRYIYQGRLVLIVNSNRIDPDEWGWLAKVSSCKKSIEEMIAWLAKNLTTPDKLGKLGIVCSGGGIPGAFYEVGCLKYLSEIGVVNKFNIYVGTSCGSYILSLLVNRITLDNLERDHNLGFMQFFQPNLHEYAKKVLNFVKLPKDIFLKIVNNPFELLSGKNGKKNDTVIDGVFKLSRFFPSALLDTSKIRKSLEDIIDFYGGTNSFDEVRKQGRELYITTVDLDTSESKILGEEGEKTSISEAVEASIAIPGVYRSKVINGRYYTDGAIKNNTPIDTAVEKGAEMIIVLHPLVPYMGGDAGFIYKLGPMALFEQSYRSLLTKALKDAIDIHKYKTPNVTVIPIHPDPRDPSNFTHLLNASPSLQKRSIEKGYEDTKKALDLHADFITRTFHRYGYDIHIGAGCRVEVKV